MGKLTFSFLVIFTVSLIIGDIYDLMPTSITDNESNKIRLIVKWFLVFILKSLLISIEYKLSGLKSRWFIFRLISLIIFITFTILIYSGCLSLSEIYKVCTILTSAFILDWLGIPNFKNPCICTVLPDISKSNMASNDHNRSEQSLPNRNTDWVPENENRLYKSSHEWREAQQRKGLTSSMDEWWEANHGNSANSSQTNMNSHNSQNSQNNTGVHSDVNVPETWGALNEVEQDLLATEKPRECVKKMSDIDKCLSDINDIKRGKEGTQGDWRKEYQPGVPLEDIENELREDKRILGIRLNRLWGEMWGKKKRKVQPKRPHYVNRQNHKWDHNEYERAGAHVRKDRFIFHKEIFKNRGNSPVRDEINKINKWD